MKGTRFANKRKRSLTPPPQAKDRKKKLADGILGKVFGAYTHKFEPQYSSDEEAPVALFLSFSELAVCGTTENTLLLAKSSRGANIDCVLHRCRISKSRAHVVLAPPM